MSARVYPNNELVLMTDGGGMVAFTTNATGLMANDASKLGSDMRMRIISISSIEESSFSIEESSFSIIIQAMGGGRSSQ